MFSFKKNFKKLRENPGPDFEGKKENIFILKNVRKERALNF